MGHSFTGLFFILALSSFSVSASYIDYKTYCNIDTPEKSIESVFLDTEEGDGFNCDKIESYINTINNLNQISPVTINGISLNIVQSGWDASNLINLISLPQDFERSNADGDYNLNSSLSQNYLAHEYAHSIFSEFLAFYFPEFKASIEEIKANNNIGNEMKRLSSLGKETESNDLLLILEGKEEVTFSSDKVMKPIFHVIAMSELFSDLVSVFFAEDLQAFSRAAAGQNPTYDQIEDNRSRDFSEEIAIQGWTDSENHNLYSPVRSYIGKLIKFPMSRAQKKNHLEKLLLIMSKELVDTYGVQKKKTPQELNLRLIKLLKEKRFLQ